MRLFRRKQVARSPKQYQFNAGYNTMKFNADQIGRHILYFIVDNQPSNVVIVDVFAQAPQVSALYLSLDRFSKCSAVLISITDAGTSAVFRRCARDNHLS